VHHDIKLENILFKQGKGLLCDLGLCRKASDPKKCRGTPGYVAPELLDKKAFVIDLKKTDIFSFGVVLLTIIDPSKGLDLLALQYDLIEGRTVGSEYLELHQQFLDTLSKDDPLVQLIIRTLDLDPSKRPTSEELLQQLTDCLSKRGGQKS
jgi:serine/threonine protein kinase